MCACSKQAAFSKRRERSNGRAQAHLPGSDFPTRRKQRRDGARTDGDFLQLKGDVENLLHPFQHKALTFDDKTADYYHPGRSARALMDGVAVAQFGQIHPDIAAARKLRQDVLIAELYLDQLYAHGLRASALRALAALSGGGARFFVCLRRWSGVRED